MNCISSFALRCVAASFAIGFIAAAPALAQPSPFNKPVRFIVPYPPGGPTDITARVYAEKVSKLIGQSVVVENKPGAQGVPAVQQLMQLPADGHSMYFGTLSTQVVSHVITAYRKQPAPYDARKDLVPVSTLGSTSLVLMASNASGITSYKQLVDTMKKQPGKFNFGSDGTGSLTHLGGEMIKQATDTFAVHIPYKGTAEFSQALITGDIQFAVTGSLGAVNLVKQNRARALAIAGPKRSDQLPGVPTTAELGQPGVDLTSWFAVFMKAGTPKANVDAMAQAIRQAGQDPELVQRLTSAGLDVGTSASPEQFAAQIDAEWKRWTTTLDKAAIKFEN